MNREPPAAIDPGDPNSFGDATPSRIDPATRLPAGIRVLLVDDRPEEVRLLGEMLRRAGAQVLLAIDGREALRLARELQPCVILLDVNLPPPDGFQVCALLHQEPQTADIPVLFLSGRTDPGTKLRGFAAGGRDYVTKPFVESEVLARVSLHVDLARRLAPEEGRLQRPGDAPPWLAAAIALLQAQMAVTPHLTDLAHQVGTNPRSLNTAFRSHLGNTVFGYLREFRLKEAHRLLVETALPIQQIALRVGYPQATNFTTAFRERFGVSPRQLRREPNGSEDG